MLLSFSNVCFFEDLCIMDWSSLSSSSDNGASPSSCDSYGQYPPKFTCFSRSITSTPSLFYSGACRLLSSSKSISSSFPSKEISSNFTNTFTSYPISFTSFFFNSSIVANFYLDAALVLYSFSSSTLVISCFSFWIYWIMVCLLSTFLFLLCLFLLKCCSFSLHMA